MEVFFSWCSCIILFLEQHNISSETLSFYLSENSWVYMKKKFSDLDESQE